MRTIFLSMSFRPEDSEKTRTLADTVGRLLQSHNISYDLGRDRGERLTPMIKRQIAETDGLIALMTRRAQLIGAHGSGLGTYTTSPWVKDELAHARRLGKPSIALVEEGVEIDGMEADYEHIPWVPAEPLESVLRLSATLRAWKQSAGRTIVAKLQPIEAASLAVSDKSARLRYKIIERGKTGKWYSAEPLPFAEGAYVHLNVYQDDAEVLVELKSAGGVWRSDLEREVMVITLKKQD